MPTNEIKFTVRQLPSAEVVKGLAEVVAAAAPDTKCSFTVHTNLLEQHLRSDNIKTTDLLGSKPVVKLLEELRSRPHIVCISAAVALPQPQGCRITYNGGDKTVASVSLHDVQKISSDQRLKFTDAMAERFLLSTEAQVVAESLPPIVQESLRYREHAVAALHAEVSKLAGLGAEQMQRNDEFIRSRVDELDKRYDVKDAKLEEDYHNKKEQLDRREEEHRAKVAEFELRESTAVRRDLLKQMRKQLDLQKEIKLSHATEKKRYVIHGVCLAALLVGVAVVACFAAIIFSKESTNWRHVAPITAGLLLFGSTLVYYMRWTNAWFREHAEAEFRNKRFGGDILRASWLAELAFEWHKEEQEVLPESLITNFSRNLFVDERFADTEHPADMVAAAVKGISKMSVGKEGVNVEMKDRR